MPFQKTSHTSVSRQIHAPKKKILNLLHDPHKFFLLNPLVTDIRPDEKVLPDSWIITDVLTFGCWKKTLEYQVHSRLHENGIDSEITANSMGFKAVISSKFTVKGTSEEHTCEVVEDYTILANALLMPYILSTQGSAHNKLMDNLKEVLEKED